MCVCITNIQGSFRATNGGTYSVPIEVEATITTNESIDKSIIIILFEKHPYRSGS